MSRTFRCRHSVPAGFVVRDDNKVYSKQYAIRLRERKRERRWIQAYRLMDVWYCPEDPSIYPREFRRRWSKKERKEERKLHYRKFRARTRDRLAHEDWDNLPRFRRTGGWLTW